MDQAREGGPLSSNFSLDASSLESELKTLRTGLNQRDNENSEVEEEGFKYLVEDIRRNENGGRIWDGMDDRSCPCLDRLVRRTIHPQNSQAFTPLSPPASLSCRLLHEAVPL